jgi:hypothetical protein
VADKVLAKFGPGKGPWVYVGNMREPTVLVSGLLEGEVQMESSWKPEEVCSEEYKTMAFLQNGQYQVGNAEYMRIRVASGNPAAMIFVKEGG